MVRAHLELGRRRAEGQHLLRVLTPGPDTGGSTVIQVVTDDRPFLVDTITMELTRRDWSIRRLFHPQLTVTREDGVLRGIATGRRPATAESWISLEVFPPLGRAAADLTPSLVDALDRALDAVTKAVDDWQVMQARALESVDLLDSKPQPVSPHEVRSAIDLLSWLAEDHFVFLGYREYTYDGVSYHGVPGIGPGHPSRRRGGRDRLPRCAGRRRARGPRDDQGLAALARAPAGLPRLPRRPPLRR